MPIGGIPSGRVGYQRGYLTYLVNSTFLELSLQTGVASLADQVSFGYKITRLNWMPCVTGESVEADPLWLTYSSSVILYYSLNLLLGTQFNQCYSYVAEIK